MKAKLLPLALLLSLGACVPNETPVRILDTYGLKGDTEPGECKLEDFRQYAGSLDIAVARSYLLALKLSSEITDSASLGGTAEFTGHKERNAFEVQQIALSYTSTPRLNLPAENVPAHIIVHQNEVNTDMLAYMIGPAAMTVLADNIAVGDSVDLVVNFQLRGALLSGQPLSTNTIKFPIEVYNSGTTACVAPDRAAYTGPCGATGGQDGTAYRCCSTFPTGKGCM
jgi:hypothetical protein